MARKRCTAEQIIGMLQEADRDTTLKSLAPEELETLLQLPPG